MTAHMEQPADSGELAAFRGAIEAKYQLHIAAYESRDAEPILEQFFTEDALWEYANYARCEGRADLRDLFEKVVVEDQVAVRPIKSFVCGDSGWDYADYQVTPRDAARTPWIFRQMFCWVRRNGDWRVNACIGFTMPPGTAF